MTDIEWLRLQDALYMLCWFALLFYIRFSSQVRHGLLDIVKMQSKMLESHEKRIRELEADDADT